MKIKSRKNPQLFLILMIYLKPPIKPGILKLSRGKTPLLLKVGKEVEKRRVQALETGWVEDLSYIPQVSPYLAPLSRQSRPASPRLLYA